MSKKRGREPDAADAGQEDGERSRRTGMADIARKRAQHFATFADEDAEAVEGNVHVGSNQVQCLGLQAWGVGVQRPLPYPWPGACLGRSPRPFRSIREPNWVVGQNGAEAGP